MNTDKIKVCVPRNGDDDEHLELGLNGRMFVIRRGEEISVEPALYEILVHAGLASPKQISAESEGLAEGEAQ